MHTLNLISSVYSFLGLGVTVFTIVFASVVTNGFASSVSTGSLISWTCRWQGYEDIAPASFGTICNQASAGLDLVFATLIFQIFAISATAGGWWIQMKIKLATHRHEKYSVELR